MPPPARPESEHRVHPSVRTGYDRAAEIYERARPPAQSAACDWLIERLGLAPGDAVVELGAGTGKLTRLLVERGLAVSAIEPVPAMRALLEQIDGPVTALDAVAEDLPLATGSARAVLASQSLHWCDVPRALAECERVLAPGGGVGLVWNLRDLSQRWQRELQALMDRLRGDAPHSRDGRWQRAVRRSRSFAVAERRSWRWSEPSDRERALERVASVSYVAALDEPERAAVLAEAGAIVDRRIAELDGRPLTFPYDTRAYVLRRIVEVPPSRRLGGAVHAVVQDRAQRAAQPLDRLDVDAALVAQHVEDDLGLGEALVALAVAEQPRICRLDQDLALGGPQHAVVQRAQEAQEPGVGDGRIRGHRARYRHAGARS